MRVDWEEVPSLGLALARLVRGRDDRCSLSKKWALAYRVAFKTWADASGVSVLDAHPYAVRHAGASSDALRRRRSLAEIQARGRWRTIASVRLYQQNMHSFFGS